MPINVTCSNCLFAFHVDDEFAGRLGRCPECTTVLQVPGEELVPSLPEPPAEHDPYHSHRSAKAFDEFPTRRVRSDDYRGHEGITEKPKASPRVLRFDKEARAARWNRVSHGLRNLIVAVVLMSTSELLGATYTLIEGAKPGAQNAFGARFVLFLGSLFISAISLGLWSIGRIGCARVPYVPARGPAIASAIIAGMTGASGVCGLAGMLIGLLVIQQGNLIQGAVLTNLGVCGVMPALFGFFLAEVLGLWSQIRMAQGLGDVAFARSSRVMMLILTGLALLSMCVMGLLMVALVAQQQEEQRKENQQAQERQRLLDAQPGREKNEPGKDELAGKLKPRIPPKREPARPGTKSDPKPAPGNGIEVGRAKPNAPMRDKVVVGEDKPSEVNKQVQAGLAAQPGAQAPPPDLPRKQSTR